MENAKEATKTPPNWSRIVKSPPCLTIGGLLDTVFALHRDGVDLRVGESPLPAETSKNQWVGEKIISRPESPLRSKPAVRESHGVGAFGGLFCLYSTSRPFNLRCEPSCVVITGRAQAFMNSVKLGRSSLQSSRLAFGCWRIAGTWNPIEVDAARFDTGRQAVIAAYEAGYTLFDHADIYSGGMGETIFGQVLREIPGMRAKILIATKCAIRRQGDPDPASPYRYDTSARHIIASCEDSLGRLGVETIDIYQLHRPDYLADPAEIASAFADLRKAGKVREFGVSNFRPSQVEVLQRFCPMPLLVNQVEISLARLCAFDDGTLDQCLGSGITPLAWSPLGGGSLGTAHKANESGPHHTVLYKLISALDAIGQARGVSRTTIALAWLLKHPAGIVPIVGSTNPGRIAEAVRAEGINLSRDEWYSLIEAARGERLP